VTDVLSFSTAASEIKSKRNTYGNHTRSVKQRP